MIRRIFYKLLEWRLIAVLRRKPAERGLSSVLRRPALPQGAPVPALLEGRESVLTKEIERIEKEANSGCGQYYELYEPRVLRALRALKSRLCPDDLAIFNRINHWDISDEAYAASCRAESEVWAEIRSGYDCDDEY